MNLFIPGFPMVLILNERQNTTFLKKCSAMLNHLIIGWYIFEHSLKFCARSTLFALAILMIEVVNLFKRLRISLLGK